MTTDEYILQLKLAGKHKEAEELAHRITLMFREDPTTDGPPTNPVQCMCYCQCQHIFTKQDCQHEVMDKIVCDRCFLHCYHIQLQE